MICHKIQVDLKVEYKALLLDSLDPVQVSMPFQEKYINVKVEL